MLGGTTALMSVNYVIWVAAGQYFLAYKLKLFPIWGYENWTYLMLPVLIGVVSGLGPDVRFYRTVVLDEMRKPYVRTALAKGLSPARILFRHILKKSILQLLRRIILVNAQIFCRLRQQIIQTAFLFQHTQNFIAVFRKRIHQFWKGKLTHLCGQKCHCRRCPAARIAFYLVEQRGFNAIQCFGSRPVVHHFKIRRNFRLQRKSL